MVTAENKTCVYIKGRNRETVHKNKIATMVFLINPYADFYPCDSYATAASSSPVQSEHRNRYHFYYDPT